jgi:hypothetical protein
MVHMDFEAYRGELVGYCYRMSVSLIDAEDLVQGTILRAWRARHSYDATLASVRARRRRDLRLEPLPWCLFGRCRSWLLGVCVGSHQCRTHRGHPYLVPPIAIVVVWLLLGDAPARLAFAGGVLCLAHVAVT